MTRATATDAWVSNDSSTHDDVGNFSPTTRDSLLSLCLKIPFGIVLTMIIITGIIGNGIVCFIVYRKPIMRSAINMLLANMALFDVALAVFCMPLSLVTLFTDEWILGDFLCQGIAFLQQCFISIGVWTMMTISIDRYLIIVYKKDKLTTQHAKTCIGLTWCAGLFMSLPPFFGFGKYTFAHGHVQCYIASDGSTSQLTYAVLISCVSFFLPFLVIGFSYSSIIIAVHKNSLKIHSKPEVDFAVTYQSGKLGLPIVQSRNSDISWRPRTFKTVLVLSLVCSACWLPYAIELPFRGPYISGQNIICTIILWIGYLKVALNPIMYFIRIEKFREACRGLAPNMIKISTRLPQFSSRRINPSSRYEYREWLHLYSVFANVFKTSVVHK